MKIYVLHIVFMFLMLVKVLVEVKAYVLRVLCHVSCQLIEMANTQEMGELGD